MQHFSGYSFRALAGHREASRSKDAGRKEVREASLRDVVALIDSRPFVRASVELLLENCAGEFCVVPFASPEEFLASLREDTELVSTVLFNIGGEELVNPGIEAEIVRLMEHAPASALIILSDREDKDQIRRAFRLGARGYIPSSIEPRLAIEAVRLVQAGGKFLPPQLVEDTLEAQPPAAAPAPAAPHPDAACDTVADHAGLTQRQWQVLSLLREGKQNKIIAYELKMRESTVKVHVRQIMRKLHASNRTEVVIRAAKLFEQIASKPPADGDPPPLPPA